MSVPSLRRVLGLWDIVAMNIVAVVGLRWIARSARLGAPSVTLWVLAWIAFFLPLTVAIVELSSRHSESGVLSLTCKISTENVDKSVDSSDGKSGCSIRL